MKGEKADKLVLLVLFTSQTVGVVLKIILLYFFVPLTIFLLFFDFFLFSFSFVSIDVLALIGVNKVTRLRSTANSTVTSPTARNSMLEGIYSVVQVCSLGAILKLSVKFRCDHCCSLVTVCSNIA